MPASPSYRHDDVRELAELVLPLAAAIGELRRQVAELADTVAKLSQDKPPKGGPK